MSDLHHNSVQPSQNLRHNFFRLDAIGNLRKGERYVQMDFTYICVDRRLNLPADHNDEDDDDLPQLLDYELDRIGDAAIVKFKSKL
ncbi:hypothetical protein C8J57DRAFT_1515250 [Mycena rebaudengoi]|nr:hypothetical protein C8J57DRAFT_1515250 [Mycena rebaudengoi]